MKLRQLMRATRKRERSPEPPARGILKRAKTETKKAVRFTENEIRTFEVENKNSWLDTIASLVGGTLEDEFVEEDEEDTQTATTSEFESAVSEEQPSSPPSPRDRHLDFLKSVQEAQPVPTSRVSHQGAVISSNFDEQDEFERQFAEFKASIKADEDRIASAGDAEKWQKCQAEFSSGINALDKATRSAQDLISQLAGSDLLDVESKSDPPPRKIKSAIEDLDEMWRSK